MRLGLGFALGVVATLAAVGVIVVLTGGKDSKRNIPARSAPGRHVSYTLRQGNVVRDPLTATQCEASGEAGKPNLFCTRTTRGRYQFVFYSDAVLVFDLQKTNREPFAPDYVSKWIAQKP
jgi:hypothetical protein